MSDKKTRTTSKRLPKGQRTHTRRLKQAARKEAGAENPQNSPARPAPAPKPLDQA